MRVRTLTVGITINNVEELCSAMEGVSPYLNHIADHLNGKGYEIQTLRICTNSFEEWLLPIPDPAKNSFDDDYVQNVRESLTLIKTHCLQTKIKFLSLGPATSLRGADIIPLIIEKLDMASVSLEVPPISDPNHTLFVEKAHDICYNKLGRANSLYNFRFCASFNCPPGIPFFPASYFTSNQGERKTSSEVVMVETEAREKYALMVGLECSDLLVEAFVNKCDEQDSLSVKQDIYPTQLHLPHHF